MIWIYVYINNVSQTEYNDKMIIFVLFCDQMYSCPNVSVYFS